MNWKSRIRKLTRWRTKNERRTDEERWRTTENLHWFAYGNISEALRKHLGLDFLHGNNFFHPKQFKCIAKGVRDRWNNPLSPIYRKKGGGGRRPAHLVELGCFLQKQPCFENILEGLDWKIWKLLFAPILISSPPFFPNLRQSYRNLRIS